MEQVRILLVDDHALIREGLALFLRAQADFQVVGGAARGEEACRLAQELHPDVVLMDVSMPGLGGAGATKRLHELCPASRVLAFSAYEDEVYVRQLLTAGAAGYVLKRSSTEELVRAVRAVAQGGTYLDPALATTLAKPQPRAKRTGASHELSPSEEQILRLVARGYTNKEIANLMGYSMKTIETQKRSLCRKLDLHSRADLVRYALDRGWLEGDGPLN